MRKSNQAFSDPANGGVLNLNQLHSKPSSSSMDVQSLLVPNSLCCGQNDDLDEIKNPFQTQSPPTRPPATLSPGGGLQFVNPQDKKFF